MRKVEVFKVVMATDILVVSRYSVIFKEMNKQTKANTWDTNLLRHGAKDEFRVDWLSVSNDLCNH